MPRKTKKQKQRAQRQRLAQPAHPVPARVAERPAPADWPLLACYGPKPEVWQTSGFGAVFVARRKPNGREAWAFAVLSLPEGGYSMVGTKTDAADGEHLDMLRTMGNLDAFPASVAMPESATAEYLYGACAVGGGALPPTVWPPRMREEPLAGSAGRPRRMA